MPESKSLPIALVTGGSRGIGRAIARHLNQQNFQVAITGRNPDSLKKARKTLGDSVHAYAGDASNPQDVEHIVSQVTKDLGPIDLLVNNAGISGPGGPFIEWDPEDWWRVQEVNLRGPMLFMRQVLPGMVERKRGNVFNVGSYAAIFNLPGNAAYGVSKAALARLTDAVAPELEGTGVNLYCLSPGLVETDMTRDVPFLKEIPPEEWSKQEDICHLISRLLEANCSALSGHFFHVNDDFDTILEQTEKITANGLYRLGMHNLNGKI